MFAESRPEVIEDMRQAADELRAELAGDLVTFVVNRNINVSNVCTVGCAFCGFGGRQALARRLRALARRLRRAASHDALDVRRDRDLHAVGHPPRLGARGLPRLAAAGQGDRAARSTCTRTARWRSRTCATSPGSAAARGLRAAARGRPGLRARHRRRGPRTTACASGSARTSCRSRAGWRSSSAAHAIGLRSTVTVMFGHIETPAELAEHMRVVRALQDAHRRLHRVRAAVASSRSRRCSAARTGSRRSRARRTSSTPRSSGSRSGAAIPSLQASWVKMGLDAATEALRWGVNDLGGTLMEESISRMAGADHGVKLEPDDLVAAAHRAGRPAAERTTLYEHPRATTTSPPPREAGLVLGPLLRYAGEHDEATIWVADRRRRAGRGARRAAQPRRASGRSASRATTTRSCTCTGLPPDASTPYEVRARRRASSGPSPTADFPPSVLRTHDRGATPARIVFGSCRVAAPHEPPHTLRKDEHPDGREVDALRGARAADGRRRSPTSGRTRCCCSATRSTPTRSRPACASSSARGATRGAARRDDRRLRGVHAPVPRVVGRADIRWLLSTVPQRDDLRRPRRPRRLEHVDRVGHRDARRRAGGDERIVGAFMSYWIYQHLGNLSPRERGDVRRSTSACATADDAGDILRDFAFQADRGGRGHALELLPRHRPRARS